MSADISGSAAKDVGGPEWPENLLNTPQGLPTSSAVSQSDVSFEEEPTGHPRSGLSEMTAVYDDDAAQQ
ncbi:hypothetical protein FRB98_003853, partial [Tulasnella sp. 332]